MSDDKLTETENKIKSDDEAIANLEHQKKNAKAVIDYMKNRTFGIRSDMLVAFCASHKWTINPKGHTRSVRNKLMGIVDTYLDSVHKREKNTGSNLVGSSADIKVYEDATRDILKLALVGFTDNTYDTLADDQDVGPALMGHLAVELKIFLVDNGGKAAAQHSQMQQVLVQLTGSAGMSTE